MNKGMADAHRPCGPIPGPLLGICRAKSPAGSDRASGTLPHSPTTSLDILSTGHTCVDRTALDLMPLLPTASPPPPVTAASSPLWPQLEGALDRPNCLLKWPRDHTAFPSKGSGPTMGAGGWHGPHRLVCGHG